MAFKLRQRVQVTGNGLPGFGLYGVIDGFNNTETTCLVILDGEEKARFYHTVNLSPIPLSPSTVVPGIGPDAPTTTNAAGGKQSAMPYRPALLPPRAILTVAGVLAEGAAKYGDDNWRKIAQKDNLDHALTHIFAHLAGDRSDDHLSHAACRVLFAMETSDDATIS